MSTEKIFNFIKAENITDAKQWPALRDNILTTFKQNVYGVSIFDGFKLKNYTSSQIIFPKEDIIRDKVIINMTHEAKPDKVLQIELYVYRDRETQDQKKPIIIMLQQLTKFKFDEMPPEEIENGNSTVAVNTFVKSGMNVAMLNSNSVALNGYHDEWMTGVFEFVLPTKPEDAKTIGAWAWGLSRSIDYLIEQKYTDSSKIAVVGHSRSGKTALWAGANDERINTVISSGSGCTGAAMAYNTTGEKLVDINTAVPHWFCDNYHKFNDRQNSLPFDQHMMLSAVAPRYLYIASASEDGWADPKNELWAARLAGQSYELLGLKPLIAPDNEDIELDKGYHEGCVAYHRKKGKHSISYKDWLLFLDFFKSKGYIK